MRKTQLLKSLSACLLLSVLCAQPALALQQTRDSHADSRIKYATYRSDEVFPVLTKEGFVTTISFEKDEEVTSYGSGYSSAWETATSENQFFLKPKTLDGETNFVIVTNKRVYSFEVRYAKKDESPTFRMIFRYPDTAAKLAKEKKEKEKLEQELAAGGINTNAVSPREEADWLTEEQMEALREDGIFNASYKARSKGDNGNTDPYNWKYSMNFGSNPGSKDIAPEAVYDDGRFTVIRLPSTRKFPTSIRFFRAKTARAKKPCSRPASIPTLIP